MFVEFAKTLLLIGTPFMLSHANAAGAGHDPHPKGTQKLSAKIEKIVTYENGLSLILDRSTGSEGDCVHIENASAFSRTKLEKIEKAAASHAVIEIAILDGHVIDVQ